MEHVTVSHEQFAAMEGLDDWSLSGDAITAEFRTGSFPAAAALVVQIADAAEAAVHHPDIDVRYPDLVRVILTTHATGGLTTLDTDLARVISALAGGA